MESYLEEGRFDDIVDQRIREGAKEDVIGVANLARRCLSLNGRNRPSMREVTMELERIQRLRRMSMSNTGQQDYEEIEFGGSFEAHHILTTADDYASTGSTLITIPSSSSSHSLLVYDTI